MLSVYRVRGKKRTVFFASNSLSDVIDSAHAILLGKNGEVLDIQRVEFPVAHSVYPTKFYRSELTTIAVYESYDEPVFYSANDSTGQVYLVLALPVSWLCTPITQEVLKRMEERKITLCEAFKSSEFAFIEYDGETTVVLTKNLCEAHLPMPGTYLGV